MLAQTAEDDEENDDDDEPAHWESFANTNPLLSADQIPGFRMKFSTISRGTRANRPPEYSVHESWVKPAPAGSTKATFINVQLHLTKNEKQALKAAKAIYHATNDPDQYLNAIGKPNPGSFTGERIGDFCWAYVVSITGKPHGPINDTSSLVVLKNGDVFKLQVTGAGDSGQGVEDRKTEKLAKQLVRRLKDWPRPD